MLSRHGHNLPAQSWSGGFLTLHYDTIVIHMIIATNRLEPSRIMETQMPPAAEELQVPELASS